MEIIFEFLYEFVMLGAIYIVKDSDLPIIARIGAGMVLFLICGGLLALFLIFAWKAWCENDYATTIVLMLFAFVWSVLVICIIKKANKDTDF